MKPRLWLQPLHGPVMVPLTMADHLDHTGHRLQSRTRQEIAWFWACPSLLQKSISNPHFSSWHPFFPPPRIFFIKWPLTLSIVIMSLSPVLCICCSLCMEWCVCLLLPSHFQVFHQSGFQCHFLRVAFFAPYYIIIIPLLCALLACFVTLHLSCITHRNVK